MKNFLIVIVSLNITSSHYISSGKITKLLKFQMQHNNLPSTNSNIQFQTKKFSNFAVLTEFYPISLIAGQARKVGLSKRLEDKTLLFNWIEYFGPNLKINVYDTEKKR